ncbi:MAG TPA: PEP-CTERM sorting domain-containing protein [Candidatus Bathyarchaeia archaeon]|nr:PEP-CTERM sorting domain-containing protein [Candidatus Bathyarchaeia archaeon]
MTISGTYLTPGNSSTNLFGSIKGGTLQVNGGNNTNAELYVPGNVTLTGATVNLQTGTSGGGGDAYLYLQNGATLDIVNSTVQGEGFIYNNGTVINNQANGVINASQIGSSPLYYLQLEYGTVNNTGLMEATNGGQLALYATTINNQGGNITNNTSGGTAGVYLYDSDVVGGNLNNNTSGFLGTPAGYSNTLDGSTGQGAVTINGTYTTAGNAQTYIYGSIVNNGALQINGGGNTNSYLYLPSNVTLTGGGTVNLSTTTDGGGGDAYLYLYNGSTLDNVNNTIQGTGYIYNNGTVFNNHTAGVINATPLASSPVQFLQLEYGTFNNNGLIEASSNASLYFYAATVNNAGNITNNSSGTGSGVYVLGSTLVGGTLNNTSGSFFGTPNGYSAYLDGQTSGPLTLNGTYTGDYNSNTYLYGSFINNGSFAVNGGANTNSYLYVNVPVSLTGGGTVDLNTTTNGGGGDAWLYLYNGITLDNVDNTIQGTGYIYNNGTVLNNHTAGVIDANPLASSPVQYLQLEYGTVNNTGLMEASNGGALYLYSTTVNNQNGNITNNSTGTGAGVYVYGGTTIQGGNLNNTSGSFFGTPNGYSAYLDGSTAAGAVTINGTYTTNYGAQTYLRGSINNQGNLLVNGGNNSNSYLYVNVPVSLTGGGTVTLSTDTTGGGGNAWLYLYNAATLTNTDNTIQGEGIIYNNGTTFINGAGGTVWANSSGAPLTTSIQLLYGTVTNNGTFQVSPGDLLWLNQTGNFTNYSANTLTGGAYNIYGTLANPGTLQIDYLGNAGGEIVNNAATIYLNGPNSNFVDQVGLDALSNFNNNMAAGSFTITNGRNFTSPSSVNFANAGAVSVGSGSTFTTGGTRNYVQSGGSTQLNGTLTAGGGSATFSGGVLFGNGGTVNGNLTMAGTIAPAATINASNVPLTAGGLSINGNYTQTLAGIFNLGLGGLAPGSQFGFLSVSGNALIDGTLNVNLLDGFFPSVGNTFTFLTTGGSVSGTFTSTNGLNIGNGEILNVIYGSNFIELSTAYSSTTDLWNGGAGVWSNASQWSIGVPLPAYDTIIYSGGTDTVTMDVGSSTVNSLTVGGPSNGFTSELTDGAVAQTLTITNGLTVGAQGFLYFTGTGSSITAATVSNSGSVSIGPGVTLNLTNQPLGVTDAPAGSVWTIGGNFAVGGVANTGFANLASIEGAVELQNGASQTIGNALAIASSGSFDVSNGTTVIISAGVNNAGSLTTGDLGTGGNTLTITGTLTNGNYFAMFGFGTGDHATIASLTNNAGAIVDVEDGSTLTITGNVTNNAAGPQGIYTSYTGTGGNTINIGGTLTNNGMFGLESAGDVVKVTGGVTNNSGAVFALTGGSSATFSATLMNAGTVDLENASSLTVHGAATNSGTLATSEFGGTGGNTMTFTALLTNGNGAQIDINGPSDTLKASAGLANSGTVTVKNGSTVDPPFLNNLGIVSIDGTSTFVVGTGTASGPGYTQLANGTLGEMITNSNFGQVFVNGSASLDGTLDILLQGGFNPSVGTTYDIILFSPGGLSGVFATIQNQVFNGGTEIWMVNYNDAGGYVSLTAANNQTPTPEPATFFMLGSGLLGIAYTARRRWLK